MGGRVQERKPVIGISMDGDDKNVMLKRDYVSAIADAGGTPILLPSRVEPLRFATVIDGLLIPGGGDIDPSYYSEKAHATARLVSRERTDFEITLLKAIMRGEKPVLGICYGMQLINVALGGTLYQDIRSQVKTALDHSTGSHRITGRGEWFSKEPLVNTSHHQAVKETGRKLEVVAVSEDHLAEAIRLTGYPFALGVQWHPERSDDELSRMLFSSFVEAAGGRK